MARITVEDCLNNNVIENRFELVILASKRGKDLGEGAHALVDRDNDKNAVIALREIAGQFLDLDVIRKNFINNINPHFASESDDIIDEDDIKDQVYEEMAALGSGASTISYDFSDDAEIEDLGEDSLDVLDMEDKSDEE
jgi:DNA-directed RNA polymerase subunit omega